jgi:hypothetical protein
MVMKKSILVFITFILFNLNVVAGDNDLFVIVKGNKEQVLDLVHKAMQVEFSDGIFENLNGRIGYALQYHSFISGQTAFTVALIPMADGDDVNPTALLLEIRFKSQKGSASYMQGVAMDLKHEIIKQASSIKDISVVNNPSDFKVTKEQADKCFDKLKSEPELQPLADKIALSNVMETTLSMLADETIPTDTEKTLISKYASMRERCEQGITAMYSYYPLDASRQIRQSFVNSATQLMVNLYKGKMTYGEFAKARKELALNAQKQYQDATANQNLQQQNATNNAAEIDGQRQQQQQQIQQQQQNKQICQTNYQRCLDRASMSGANNYNFRKSECDMTNAGCQIGSALGGMGK